MTDIENETEVQQKSINLSGKFNALNHAEIITKNEITRMRYEEGNREIDALDGESSAIPKAGTEAYAAYVGSRRDRLDRQKRKELGHILMMVQSLQYQINKSFEAIETTMENINELVNNTLDRIVILSNEIDKIQREHEQVEGFLESREGQLLNSDLNEINAVNEIYLRYLERTGRSEKFNDNLLKIIKEQIAFERDIYIPSLQNQTEKLGMLHDESQAMHKYIRNKHQVLNEEYQSIQSMEDNQVKVDAMHSIENDIEALKMESEKIDAEFEVRFKKSYDTNANELEDDISKSEESDLRVENIGLSGFGLNVPSM